MSGHGLRSVVAFLITTAMACGSGIDAGGPGDVDGGLPIDGAVGDAGSPKNDASVGDAGSPSDGDVSVGDAGSPDGGPPNVHEYVTSTKTTSAAWNQRDGARLEFFNGKYWLLGGWWPYDNPEFGLDATTNAIWSSADLATWTQELAHDPDPPTTGPTARWRRRHTFGSCVKDGYLWVFGSDGSDGSSWKSDVWRSANGTTWEQLAPSSPWGPVYLPVWSLYQNEIHIIGGFDHADGIARAQHWKSADGVKWTRLPDPPFTRAAVTKGVEHGRRLYVIGGSSGINDGTRTLHNDTWAWDGSSWQQMSTSAPWSPRDWIATASYDGRLWAMTGASPLNTGGLYYSTDEGVTWTQQSPVPYGGSHADAFTVTSQDGIVIASGNGHGNSVYSIKAFSDPSVAMPLQAWTSWFDGASFASGSTSVSGKASAGTSATRTFDVQGTPGVGSIDGRPTIVLDGVKDHLRYFVGAESAELIGPAGWTIHFVGKISTPTSDSANPYANASLGGSTDAWFAVGVRSSGPTIEAYQFQGADKIARTTFTADTLVCVQARYDGTNVSVRINKGPWVNTASGTPTAMAGTFRVGSNYNATTFVRLEIADYATANVALSDEVLDACVDDAKTKYPSLTL